MMNVYPGPGQIFVIIFLTIILLGIFSALGGLVLWGCARGIGKVKNATYLNSWGLFWILGFAQLFVGIVNYIFMFFIFGLGNNQLTYGLDALYWYPGIFIFSYLICYIISIGIALGITKAFWKCTLMQSFMTHLVPMIIYFITICIYVIFLTLYFRGL